MSLLGLRLHVWRKVIVKPCEDQLMWSKLWMFLSDVSGSSCLHWGSSLLSALCKPTGQPAADSIKGCCTDAGEVSTPTHISLSVQLQCPLQPENCPYTYWNRDSVIIQQLCYSIFSYDLISWFHRYLNSDIELQLEFFLKLFRTKRSRLRCSFLDFQLIIGII